MTGVEARDQALTKFIKDEVDYSKVSNQDSLSSKLGSTVATADIESDSDSDCDVSFFCEKISESASQAEEESVKQSEDDQPKKSHKQERTKKKKKKGEKTEKLEKKKNKKRGEEPEKSEKKKKKREKSGKSKKKRRSSEKRAGKSAKQEISKERSLFDTLQEAAVKAMEHSHSDSDDSWESHYVVPQIQNQEELQKLPYGPPLWGDTEEENSYGDAWEEDKSWNGWNEPNDVGEECVEEALCDDGSRDGSQDGSNDGFSYYTVQSNDDLGFPEHDDIENDDVTVWDEVSESPESVDESEPRRVRFSEHDTIHSTLHICDFTRGEINRSWYQQNDYEETIQDVKEVASSSESPRDTQKRRRKQRLLLSKSPDTRGLEAWTPSGVQRFRYVKEAAFRAVWDEQQKQLDQLYENGEDNNSVDLAENIETLREAYQRVTMRSQKEAQERAKKDEEVAEKLRPRLGGLQRGGSRRNLARFKKSIGSSSKKLLDGNSSHDLSDSPAAPPSCLRKTVPIEENFSESQEANKRVWFRDSARKFMREKSDAAKPELGSFKQSSDRGLIKKNPERGLNKKSSDRSLFTSRGLFKQTSDRSIFKKSFNFGSIREEEEESSSDMHSEKPSTVGNLFGHKQTRRSSDGILSGLKSDRRGMLKLSRQNSEPVFGEKVDPDC